MGCLSDDISTNISDKFWRAPMNQEDLYPPAAARDSFLKVVNFDQS
jgi:hypothetical protein